VSAPIEHPEWCSGEHEQDGAHRSRPWTLPEQLLEVYLAQRDGEPAHIVINGLPLGLAEARRCGWVLIRLAGEGGWPNVDGAW
jgi:hypothetical protein